MKVAVYPGSFDPITNGHLDILERSLKVFDKVIVLLAINPDKKSRFSFEDRLVMIKESVKHLKNVEVDFYDGLTVDYAKKHGANTLIRGLREPEDYEFECSYAAANQKLNPSIDMVFFMSRGKTIHLASSKVIELYKSGKDIKDYVPPIVLGYLKK